MSNDHLPNVSPEEERYFSKKEFDRREFVRQRLEREVKVHRELRHIGEAVGEERIGEEPAEGDVVGRAGECLAERLVWIGCSHGLVRHGPERNCRELPGP